MLDGKHDTKILLDRATYFLDHAVALQIRLHHTIYLPAIVRDMSPLLEEAINFSDSNLGIATSMGRTIYFRGIKQVIATYHEGTIYLSGENQDSTSHLAVITCFLEEMLG